MSARKSIAAVLAATLLVSACAVTGSGQAGCGEGCGAGSEAIPAATGTYDGPRPGTRIFNPASGRT
ncbi:MAG: hypothetical protein ACLGIS_18565, partial [Actinomycetes bacterium]